MKPSEQQPTTPTDRVRLDPAGAAARTPSEVVEHLRTNTRTRLAHSKRFRVNQLEAFDRMLTQHRQELLDALQEDLGKSSTEAQLTELAMVNNELDHARRHLDDWMHTRSIPTPFALSPATATVSRRPLGLVLIIAPWNYPVNLTLIPLVDAIAAGNAVVLKPSELAPATARVLERIVPQHLDHRAVAVVNGGAEVNAELLRHKFDHILYTGGERVGRIVYEAAAKQLTPVTLELGGKCPVVVADGDPMGIARRIAYGKFANAGQTCVAPDYVLAVGPMAKKLERAFPKVIQEFYGSEPKDSKDFGRIINASHVSRLEGLLSSGRTLAGGQVDAGRRYVAPTILTDVTGDDPVMQEEIFGPILPIIAVPSVDDALRFIGDRPDPLAAYIFSERGHTVRAFEDGVRAGAVGVNQTILHLAVPELPFGGVGASGIGAYHGRAGFETFSQARPTLSKNIRLDTLKALYPPYGAAKSAVLRKLV
ncbi:MAG: aldehyde dehydrogenase family protein [Galactobacter sp.]